MSTMSFLSLASDSAVIDVTWARMVAMLELPSVIVLEQAAANGRAQPPIRMLLEPPLTVYPAQQPIPMLLQPVVFLLSALYPWAKL